MPDRMKMLREASEKIERGLRLAEILTGDVPVTRQALDTLNHAKDGLATVRDLLSGTWPDDAACRAGWQALSANLREGNEVDAMRQALTAALGLTLSQEEQGDG